MRLWSCDTSYSTKVVYLPTSANSELSSFKTKICEKGSDFRRLGRSFSKRIGQQKYVLIQATNTDHNKTNLTKKIWNYCTGSHKIPKKIPREFCEEKKTFVNCSCCTRRVKNQERFAKYYDAIRDVGLIPIGG